jgi:uroporphyrinogen-III synthase
MRLLVTRPEPDCLRTAEALRSRGHDALVSPMLRMEPLNPEIPDRHYRGVVLTSANAARAVAAHLRANIFTLPVLAVGKHTADAARAAGFRDVRSSDGDSSDLLRLLKNEAAIGGAPYLYLAGEERAADLAQTTNIVTAEVYRMTPIERLAPAAESKLRAGQVEGVMHFSTRSVRAYLHCATSAQMLASALAPVQFCLSEQVTAPLRAAGAAAIRIAIHPDEAALIDLLREPAAAANSAEKVVRP